MGILKVLLTIIIGWIILKCYYLQEILLSPSPIPTFNFNEYYGDPSLANSSKNSTIIQFKVKISDVKMKELQEVLRKFEPKDLSYEVNTFEYGITPAVLDSLVSHWRDFYLPRWEEFESEWNKFAHYKTRIQGVDIHFTRIKLEKSDSSSVQKSITLLLLHGWPNMFIEYFQLIPHLNKSVFNFDIIIPSLPGMGFSGSAYKKGLAYSQIAILLEKLMDRLGINRFVIQGSDWGSAIGSSMATLFPENVILFHSHNCFALMTPKAIMKRVLGNYFPSLLNSVDHISFFYPLSIKLKRVVLESGYFHTSATTPHTIGIILERDPIALAAYIFEKYSFWWHSSNRLSIDGGIPRKYYDDILHSIMIHYMTGSITSSIRLYTESFNPDQNKLNLDRVPTVVPTQCMKFRHELFASTDWELSDKYINMKPSEYHDHSGHFGVLENSELVANSLLSFIGQNLNKINH